MVKCRKHPYEQGVGVCASCLRERLLAVIAAQSGRPQHCCAGTPVQQGPPAAAHPFQQQKRKPPLVFPRSVSPYVSHRRSVDQDEGDDRCHRRNQLRFYSTPQVGPAGGGRKRAGGGFSIFSSLFGGGHHFRSEDTEQDSGASTGPSRSGSWFAALIPGRRKKKDKDSKHFAAEAAEEDGVRRSRMRRRDLCHDRGMSPAGDESGCEDGSEPGSGSSTESPNEWRRPTPTPLRKPAPAAHRGMSGFVVCLGPLVRASPRRGHVAEGGGAAGPSGEPRGVLGVGGHRRRRCHHHHHHQRQASGLGAPPSLGPNRSRKLVDLGRFR